MTTFAERIEKVMPDKKTFL